MCLISPTKLFDVSKIAAYEIIASKILAKHLPSINDSVYSYFNLSNSTLRESSTYLQKKKTKIWKLILSIKVYFE